MSEHTPTLAELLAAKEAAYARWIAADAAHRNSTHQADQLRAQVQELTRVCEGHARRRITREDGVSVEVGPSDEERARALEELPSLLARARQAHVEAVADKHEREDAGKANTEAAHRWQAAIHVLHIDGR